MRAKTLSASQRWRICCSRAGRSTCGGSAANGPVAEGELTPSILPEPANGFRGRPPARGPAPGRDTAPTRAYGRLPAWGWAAGEHDGDVALGIGALVVLVAAVALRLADRLGLPSLLLYLALGVALGEGGLGVQFEDYELTHTLGYAALVVILAEGGLTTRWADVRRAIGPGIALSTVGRRGERGGHRARSRCCCSATAGASPSCWRR